MDNTVTKINYLDMISDSLCEYVIGKFYSQMTYKIITAFLINDKAIIHTSNGQTVIEHGLEPSVNIINRMKEISGNDTIEDKAISIHIGDWEITALENENAVHITQK